MHRSLELPRRCDAARWPSPSLTRPRIPITRPLLQAGLHASFLRLAAALASQAAVDGAEYAEALLGACADAVADYRRPPHKVRARPRLRRAACMGVRRCVPSCLPAPAWPLPTDEQSQLRRARRGLSPPARVTPWGTQTQL